MANITIKNIFTEKHPNAIVIVIQNSNPTPIRRGDPPFELEEGQSAKIVVKGATTGLQFHYTVRYPYPFAWNPIRIKLKTMPADSDACFEGDIDYPNDNSKWKVRWRIPGKIEPKWSLEINNPDNSGPGNVEIGDDRQPKINQSVI